MWRKQHQHKKGIVFVLIFAVFCFLFVSCSSRDSGVKTVVNTAPAQQTQDPITQPAQLDSKELCVFVTIKDTSGQMLHIQDILRVAVVSKQGNDLPAEPVGISLMKICPDEVNDYLVDVLLTESKNKRVFHANFPIKKDELQKNIAKDVRAHEETESLTIQGVATVDSNAEVTYFASPSQTGYAHSDLYTGVSSYFFYVSPKGAVKASQISYDALKLQIGDVSNLRITIWCEAWSDTKGLLGYGVRTVLVTEPIASNGQNTNTPVATSDTNTANEDNATPQENFGSIEGTLTLLDDSWYGTMQCSYTDYTVEILDTAISFPVTQQGIFRLENVPLGKHTLIVKKDFREKGRLDVNVTESTIQNIQIPARC